MTADLDVVALGSAIVDVLANAGDELVEAAGLVKGTMALVDEAESARIYASMGPALEASGGSAANTAAGVASFGGRAAFIGRVRDDELGRVFAHDIQAVGVKYATPPAAGGAPTGHCLVLVTPDAQRTMATFLGAATELAPEDVDPALVRRAKVTYLEGYLWDPPEAIEALRVAIAEAHVAGGRVAMSLSDPFCVMRHRDDFLAVVEREVDLLFANEEEAMSLFAVDTVEEAVVEVGKRCEVGAVTLGSAGSVVVGGGETVAVPAAPVAKVVDTTGAGDLYAAGFLFGLTHGADLAECGRLGSLAAAEVISHLGARPQAPLHTLL
ncbi:MAG: adenosine kinase [Actinobacteria bacterium]|nr:adenosine kinase [Actinomycetota bacterium]